MFNVLYFFFSATKIPFAGKEKTFKHLNWNFKFFQQMLLKSEIIWMKISQIIGLRNHINFSEISSISQMITKFFEIPYLMIQSNSVLFCFVFLGNQHFSKISLHHILATCKMAWLTFLPVFLFHCHLLWVDNSPQVQDFHCLWLDTIQRNQHNTLFLTFVLSLLTSLNEAT